MSRGNSRAKRRMRSQVPAGPPRPQPHLLRTDGAVALAEKRPTRPSWSALTAQDLSPQQGSASWQGWATGTAGKPIPDMPSEPRLKPETDLFGASGTANFSGIITTDEYNPDLLSPIDRTAVYDQMRRNHAPIKAMLKALKQPIIRADWKIEKGTDDDAGEEIASFVDTCLMHEMAYETTEGATLRQQWVDILSHALLMYDFGFVSFELCYVVQDGWTKWAKWTPLLPRTHWRWWVGKDNELAGIQQWTFRNWNYEFVNIPAWKLLPIAYDQEGNNYEGISLLRAAYKHWMYAQNMEKIDAIAIERQAVMPPVIKLPENYTPKDIQAGQTIAQSIYANEYMGVTIPNTWDIEMLRNHGHQQTQTLPTVQYHNTMILTAALCDWMGLGHTDTGSYSLAEVKVKMLEQVLQADMKLIEQRVNTAIRRLVDYNFEDVEVYPTLKGGKVSLTDVTMFAQALQQLGPGQGGYIHPTPELEEALLDGLGLPKGTPTVVTGTNPTDPNTPEQPEIPNEDEQSGMTPADTGQQQAAGGGPQGGSGGGGQASGGAQLSESALLGEVMGAIRGVDVVERGYVFMGGHQPGYQQNRGPGGKWGPGNGPSEGEGGGGGGPRGAGGAKSSGGGRGRGGAGGGRAAKAPKSEEEQHAAKVSKAQQRAARAREAAEQTRAKMEGTASYAAAQAHFKALRAQNSAETHLANLQAARAKGQAEASGTAGARSGKAIKSGDGKSISERDVAAFTRGNPAGVPSIGYHYGTQAHIDRLNREGIDVEHNMNSIVARGFHMTPFEQGANSPYGEAHVRVAVQMHNPMVMERSVYDQRGDALAARNAQKPGAHKDFASNMTDWIKGQGHDGLVLTSQGKPVMMVAFTPGSLRVIREGTSARSGAGGGKAKAAAAPKESIHERAARLQQEGGLRAEAQPGTELKVVGNAEELAKGHEAFGALDAHYLAGLYGEHQLGAALARYPMASLKEAAAGAGVKASSSKAETISRITAAVTQGRYSANFPKAAGGGKASGTARAPKAEGAVRSSRSARSTSRAADLNTVSDLSRANDPGWHAGSTRTANSGAFGKLNPWYTHALYGSGQLHQALVRYPMTSLREAAGVIRDRFASQGIKASAPSGRTRDDLAKSIADSVIAHPQDPFNADAEG